MKILAIDDDPVILRCIDHILTKEGYEVITTANETEALGICRSEEIDLILLDIRMANLTGFDLYELFRQRTKAPVLFVTAYPKSFTTESEQVLNMWQTSFGEGTTDILYKPFEVNPLREKVLALIGEAKEAV